MLRLLDLANALTVCGIWCALAAALLAIAGEPHLAWPALVLAGLCDLYDGVLARRLVRDERARAFGARLDSAADACAFGMAPAVICFGAGCRGPWEVAALALVPAAAAWRLAWFDLAGLVGTGEARWYTGLPVTYAALLLPLAGLADALDPAWLRPALAGTCAAMAALMVSGLRIRKPYGAWYALLVALAALLVAGHLWVRTAPGR